MIHFISPYAYDLNIGRALNNAVTERGWYCHCDHDTLKPTGFAERLRKVIETGISKNVVLTCRTNRVGHGHPAVVNELFDESNINVHLGYAKYAWERWGTDTQPTENAPGYCMVFHSDHLEKHGGFPEHSITFDRWLSNRSKPHLMMGLYIFHLYRWGSKNPSKDYKHLLDPGSYLK